jgi:hypothetical protein
MVAAGRWLLVSSGAQRITHPEATMRRDGDPARSRFGVTSLGDQRPRVARDELVHCHKPANPRAGAERRCRPDDAQAATASANWHATGAVTRGSSGLHSGAPLAVPRRHDSARIVFHAGPRGRDRTPVDPDVTSLGFTCFRLDRDHAAVESLFPRITMALLVHPPVAAWLRGGTSER